MKNRVLPRYPIYVPSRFRADVATTMPNLIRDGVPFYLVVGEEEFGVYANKYGKDCILVVPWMERERNQLCRVRNFIWEHSIKNGFKRHWQLDDNINGFHKRHKAAYRLRVPAGIALSFMEDFTDSYTNVGIAGPNYVMFCTSVKKFPAFWRNTHVYSCSLIKNDMPIRFRGAYNHDVDICLQILSAGLCTLSFNAFLQNKLCTQIMKGGNSVNYAKQDFRLFNVRELVSRWPGVVHLTRRFNRPHFSIKRNWRCFDNELIPNPDFDRSVLSSSKYSLKLKATEALQSEELKSLISEYNGPNAK